ncbi:MAG: maleate cis-trans isomerase [Xanthobacteraceae bacterium]|jgi:maleate isomerase
MYGSRARIGRINPSPETVGDEEWRRLMPDDVIVVSTRMFIERVDPAGLTTMVTNVERASKELATARPNVILMAGTAGAFNGGLNFDAELSRRIERAAGGVPGTTTMSAVLAALRTLQVGKVAIATSYIPSVDQALADVLRGSGIEVPMIKGMNILKSIDMGDVEPEETYRFARDVFAAAPEADAYFISCGNLRSLDAISKLERDFGKPVITSNQAGLWHALRLAKINASGPAVGIGGHLFTVS